MQNQKLRDKIKNFGGPLTFSCSIRTCFVGAAIASANIHLSPEITIRQKNWLLRLSILINYYHKVIYPSFQKRFSSILF